jgi:hypothetical protein
MVPAQSLIVGASHHDYVYERLSWDSTVEPVGLHLDDKSQLGSRIKASTFRLYQRFP